MSDIESLLSSLDHISEQLMLLAGEHESSFEILQGTDFPEQNTIAASLDNLISESTDLMAMNIKEKQSRIRDIVSFYQFRQIHSAFTDYELSRIIDFDNHLIDFKDRIQTAIAGHDFLNHLREIRVEWNSKFDNRTYQKVRDSFL